MVVERTVLANGLAVLHQHVSVVELAGLDLAALGGRVGSGVVGLGSAGSGALGDVERSCLEDADAEVAEVVGFGYYKIGE